MKSANTKRGFTLVELALVLVIIGLIIGGVLTGQQIIQNARVTNVLNALQGFEAQFQTYTQNYGAMPGDDSSAQQRFQGVTVDGNGNGNGQLDGAGFDSVTVTDENRLAWSHLRAAGLVKNQISGNTTGIQPVNPFGGIYGFQTGAFNGAFTGNVICVNHVPTAAAEAIDSRLDDGLSNSGNVQAMASTNTVGEAVNGTVAASYGAAQSYTMCIRM